MRIEDDIWTIDEKDISKVFDTKESIPKPAAGKKGELYERVVREIEKNKDKDIEEDVIQEPEDDFIEETNASEEHDYRETEGPENEIKNEPEEEFEEESEDEIEDSEEDELPVLLLKGRNETITVDHYPFIIGRYDADYEIDSTFISGNHCEISEKNGEIYIEDLDSTNGTFIKNKKITKKTNLKNVKSLVIADRRYKIEWQL